MATGHFVDIGGAITIPKIPSIAAVPFFTGGWSLLTANTTIESFFLSFMVASLPSSGWASYQHIGYRFHISQAI